MTLHLTCHDGADEEEDAEEDVPRQRVESIDDLPLADGEDDSEHLQRKKKKKKRMVTKTAKPIPGSCIHARRQYSVLVLTLISRHLRFVGGHGLSEAVLAHLALSLLSQLRPQMHAKYPWSGPLTVAAGVRDVQEAFP